MVVEACAPRHIHVMMEKPLAVSMDHARAIQKAANSGGIHVIVNYETTWYRSHGAMWNMFKEQHAAGKIVKMVAEDGHPLVSLEVTAGADRRSGAPVVT